MARSSSKRSGSSSLISYSRIRSSRFNYARPDGKLSAGWLQLMRESIPQRHALSILIAMVKEYTERLYGSAAQAYRDFSQNECAAASDLSQWKCAYSQKDWPQIRLMSRGRE